MNDLTVKQTKVVFNPERDTTKATRAAKQLIDIIKQNGWSISLGGKKEHVFYEGWQTVGKYYNVTVATGEAENIEIGEVMGFKAKAWVVDNRTGVRVGEAEAYCMRDEPNWKTKPLFQLASMAQTRAGSKALRQIFGFVVALAGYSPTPAEEMIGQTLIDEKPVVRLVSDKQVNFIKELLFQKGFTELDLQTKYKVKTITELSSTQGSTIIENLMKLPAGVNQKMLDTEAIVDIDKADEEISRGQATSNFPND